MINLLYKLNCKREILISLFIIGNTSFYSCSLNSSEKGESLKKSQPIQNRVDYEYFKNNNLNVINNISQISNDTIILCKYISGIAISEDGGMNWSESSKSYYFEDLVYDKNKNLVAINHWVGIHEPSYSYLFVSEDFGETWKKIEFNIKKFFPVKILSDQYQQLELMTEDSLVYRLNGNDYQNDWVITKSKFDDINNEYKVDYSSDKLTISRDSNQYKIDSELEDVNDILEFNGKIYLSGSGNYKDERYNAYLTIISQNGQVKDFKIEEGSYAYLKKTKLDNLFIFGDFGAYKIINDSIFKLYE